MALVEDPKGRFSLKLSKAVCLGVVCSCSLSLAALETEKKLERGRIPDEFESDGGHSLGLGAGGSAAVSGLGSIKSNPAMLSFEKKYQISAGYHWPSVGRNFYQAGVVDSKTASLAAGVSYTSFLKDFSLFDESQSEEEREQSLGDSPLKHRIAVALSQAFSVLSVGVGAQLIDSTDRSTAKAQNGTTLTLGVAGMFSPHLRAGLSVENLGNKAIKDVAPRVLRGGVALTVFDGDLTGHLDLRHRQRVRQELGGEDGTLNELDDGAERMLIASFSARFQDLLRLLGGYGVELGGRRRSSLSGGLALVNKAFSFSYLLSRPYLASPKLHQAVNLSFQMSI